VGHSGQSAGTGVGLRFLPALANGGVMLSERPVVLGLVSSRLTALTYLVVALVVAFVVLSLFLPSGGRILPTRDDGCSGRATPVLTRSAEDECESPAL
jgi:hypothetical protein